MTEQPIQRTNKKEKPKCPDCGSTRIYNDGFRKAPLCDPVGKPVQRYRCADYGHRFSKHFSRKILKATSVIKQSSQIRVFKKEAKNLIPTQEIKTCAELIEHAPSENEIRATPQIEKLLTQLENDGRAPGTIDNYRKALGRLLREGADLFDTENTKSVLTKTNMAKNAKRGYSAMLNKWFDFIEVKWKRPTYRREKKIPYIPTERLLDELIAALGPKTATYCQLLKETGARAGEISALTWDGIDFERKTVNIVAEKGSNPRLLRVSQKALEMVANLKRRKKQLFSNADDMRSCFFMQRRRISK